MGIAPDWGTGAYEVFAEALVPAAERLVQIAAPQLGERAIDLGCGTGNATIPLARTGVHVTAVDPSLRLLAITASRAREEGIRITTALARAEELPLPDGDADVVVSNFGVIFSSDPAGAITETLRVLTPQGRFVFSTWLPDGPLDAIRRLMFRAVARDAEPPFAPAADGPAAIEWHEPESYAHLIPGGAGTVALYPGEAEFTADSPEDWVAQQAAEHPVWLAAQAAVSDDDRWRAFGDQAIEVLQSASTDPDRFAITAPYTIVEINPKR